MPYGCMLVCIIAELDQKLRQAARQGDAAGVREWLEAGADPNAPDQEYGRTVAVHRGTAMHRAAEEGKSVEVLEALRGAGAEVDKATKFGFTPLMLAALNGATGAVLRWLLEQGADWRLQATSGLLAGETALGIAKRKGQAEAASVLAAWVSEHGSAEEAAEVKHRGEAHAAHSTPNCCHASPEPACLGKMVDLSSRTAAAGAPSAVHFLPRGLLA
jgi:ankyrin repeat protein